MRGRAEMIFTGDELLRGDTVNTNQAWLGDRMLELGLFATHALSVTDEMDSIATALTASLSRCPDLVVLSGGLGPTEDDLTREAVSAALGLPLEHHEELLEAIRAQFRRLNMIMSESNLKQALIPAGASPIPMSGTAPGFWLDHHGVVVAALPGVPRELKEMWSGYVEPVMRRKLSSPPDPASAGDGTTTVAQPTGGTLVRRLRLYGIGESTLAEALRGIPWRGTGVEIGTRAAMDGITLILRAQPARGAAEELATREAEIRAILGDKVYGTGDDDMAAVVGEMLRARGLTVCTAESCTGGLIAKRFTDTAGSSDYFLGGVVTYSNRLKTVLLGVDEAVLAAHGAVSEQVAEAMARRARERLGADCAISVTGIAGPGGGTQEKPVGLVYIGTALRDDLRVDRFNMFTTRTEIRERTAQTAMDLLRRRLVRESYQTE
jgi:nicotinamide-nucleotide amidase